MKNGGGKPSERLCPDEDVNYRYSIDNIIMSIGEKQEYEDYQKRERERKR